VTGTLTIDVTGATDGTAVTAAVTMTPPADSDADAAISVTATAMDHALLATSSAAAGTLVVDAVLDEYLDVSGTTQSGTESNAGQSLGLGLHAVLANAGFTYSGQGGADTDGSEHRSVTLVLNAALPGGASFSVVGGAAIGTVTMVDATHYTITPAAGHSYDDVAAAIQVNLPANYQGTISGSIQSTSSETTSGLEFDSSDNAKSDSANFSLTVNPHVTAPTVGATVEGIGYFKEDVANTVDFTATPQEPTDHITTIVVSGLSNWTVNSGTITLSNGTVGSTSFAGGVLTINVSGATDGTPVTAHVTMTPPADSDADAAISVTATAADHALLATSSAVAGTLVVDAVLDEYLDVSGTTQTVNGSGSVQHIGLGLGANLTGAGFTYSGQGGSDTDGSEHRSVTLTLSSALPSGATLSVDSQYGTVTTSDNIHFTLTPAAGHSYNDVASHIVADVPGGFVGSISGSIQSTSAEATTGVENDTSDNSKSDSAAFSVTVNSANVPVAHDDGATVPSSVSGVSPNYNVLLVLDLSTSMDATVAGTGGLSRLEVEQQALVQLLQQYQSLSGNVKIQIETFGITAQTNGITYSSNGSSGHTLQDAITYVNGFTNSSLSSGTNYDAAIGGPNSDSGTTGSAYNIVNSWPASSSSTLNTVYFISDGVPQSGSGSGGSAGSGYLISSQQQTAWETLLTSKGASSYAIGIDLGANPTTYLQQVSDPDDSSHLITTGSVNLASVLAGIAPVTNTVTGNVLFNDKDGGDGYHTTNPILSFTHNGHTYAWDGTKFTVDGVTAAVGSGGVTGISGHDLVITTADGGNFDFNFDTGDYKYTAPVTATDESETFIYKIADNVGGDTSTAALTINVTGNAPSAYDNLAQAGVTTTTVHGTPATVTLADFGNTANTASSGAGYNPWVYDTKDDSGVAGNETSVVAVTGNTLANLLAVADNHWGVHNANSANSITQDVTVSGGTLQITDGNDNTAGGTQVATPVFTVTGTDTATVSFDVTRSGSNSSDSTTWVLEQRVSGVWSQVQNGSITGTATITTPTALTAGDYRIVFSVTDNSSSGNNLLVTVDNIKLTTTPADTQQTTVADATGNVLTNPMNKASSLDPWNAIDNVAGGKLEIWNGSAFVDAAAAGTSVVGLYGTLTINDAGDYTYHPAANVANVGQVDTFTYELVQPDGGHDTATLSIQIGSSNSLTAAAVHTGSDIADNYTAIAGDHVVLGNGGDDTLDGHNVTTSLHLEGNAGNDHLIGGTSNDFLIGGDGNDTLEGGAGFDKYDGGTGNDTIKLDLADLSSTDRHIDGGSGYDTIDLSAVSSWDFSGSGANAGHAGITSVEAVNLTGGVANTVTLDIQSVLDMSSNHTLVVSGDSADTVNLKGSAGTWTAGETGIAAGGHTYDAYIASSGGNTATVLVEHDTNVQVHLNQP
ncbi:MAG TPA: calcium-binding protein, partial [Dongiaceae bacterium]|nr:calcium-binding protein [Dongiaceae bacterium]